MGYTLETTIVLSTCLFIIVFLIIAPISLIEESRLIFEEGMDKAFSSLYEITPEEENTLITGISSCYRMIYGGIQDAVSE